MVFSCFGSIAKRLPLCVCVYALLHLSFRLGLPKVPLRPLGNDRFLLCLRPDLDGVQLFRIHCQAAAVEVASRFFLLTYRGSLLLL